MRNKTGIIILTVILTALCLFFISFSLVDRSVKNDATEYATNQAGQVDFLKKQQYLDSVYNKPVYNFLGLKEYTYKEVKQNGLNLGLDLQGGMHVTLEVSPVEILKGLSGNSTDPTLKQALEMATNMQRNSPENYTKLFYQAYKEVAPNKTLASVFANYGNRDYITKSSSDQEVRSYIEKEVDQAIDRTFLIVRTRIDKFGVTSPNIQRIQGTGRIQVELPGADNPERIRNLLQGVAKLEFLEVYQANEFYPIVFAINDYLVSKQKAEKGQKTEKVSESETQSESEEIDPLTGEKITKTTKSDTAASAADTTQEDVSKFITLALGQNLQQLGQLVYPIADTAQINAILNDPRVKAIIPASMSLFWEKAGSKQTEIELVPVKRGRLGKAPLTGDVITDAKADFASSGGGYEISMSMNASGAKAWRNLTRKAVETSTPQSRNRIAISLDNTIYSAPFVNEEIPNGVSSISGNFTEEEAKDLANVLKAGKLPAPARIVEEGIIGPSLGKEAISQGLKSSVAGLALVVVFMILYYSMGGMIANFALVFNIFFIIGILAQLHAALTLAGIAGIVLTMGMAVDANVLIFERIREELRNGKSINQAIKEGYDKAFSSIFDANLTTILIGIILVWFGSGAVQGFATVLIIGIATSFFTSVFISRVVVEFLISKKAITEKSFETVISRSFTKNVNFDFINFRRKSYIISGIIIAIGFGCIVTNGLNMGVDFKGGRSYVVQFDQAMPASDVKSALSDVFENEGIETKTYGDNTTLKITTSYMIEDESTEADKEVLAKLESGLKTFASSNPKVIGSEKVGATIANDMINASLIAVVLSLIGMFFYIFIRFKRWQFGLGAVIALTHDVLVCIAIYGIATVLGFHLEIDQIFIAAILTVIAYSVNNTVVICDRIREKSALNPKDPLSSVINRSINDTLSRTIITSLTVLIVVVTLLIFGGDVLRGFSLILIVGAIFGTYSSILIGTPIVLDLGKVELNKN
jgi:SecD/SecF fusion protein